MTEAQTGEKISPRSHRKSLGDRSQFQSSALVGNVGFFDEAQFSRKTNLSVKGHSLNKFAW